MIRNKSNNTWGLHFILVGIRPTAAKIQNSAAKTKSWTVCLRDLFSQGFAWRSPACMLVYSPSTAAQPLVNGGDDQLSAEAKGLFVACAHRLKELGVIVPKSKVCVCCLLCVCV